MPRCVLLASQWNSTDNYTDHSQCYGHPIAQVHPPPLCPALHPGCPSARCEGRQDLYQGCPSHVPGRHPPLIDHCRM